MKHLILAKLVLVFAAVSGLGASAQGVVTRIYTYEECVSYGDQVKCDGAFFTKSGNAKMEGFDWLERINLSDIFSAGTTVKCRAIAETRRMVTMECSNGAEYRQVIAKQQRDSVIDDSQTEASYDYRAVRGQTYDFSTATNIQKISLENSHDDSKVEAADFSSTTH